MTHTYQYALLRCVPRIDREEFVNVAVVLRAPAAEFLGVGWHVDTERLQALAPQLDGTQVSNTLRHLESVAAGDALGGAAAHASTSQRFGFLTAPRSTMVQPGPVHSGLCTDPRAELDRLVGTLVRV